jgi:tetratricopeptide (TPR) repeat protein
MSIINQALKKAQREQQLAKGGTAWVPPAAAEAEAPHRRGKALWIVTAAVFALSLGATLHAWLVSPTAQVGTVFKSTPSVADPISQPEPGKPAKEAGMSLKPTRQIVNPVPRRQPGLPRTASVAPTRPVPIALARRPSPPVTAADYTARGNALYRQGKYQRAIDMYQAALALDPLDVKARNNLGSTYMQLTLDDRATAAFQEVLRLDDSYSLAHYNLACVHARAGNLESAVAYLQQAVAIEPEARDWARTDGDFASLRNAPEFRQLLEP